MILKKLRIKNILKILPIAIGICGILFTLTMPSYSEIQASRSEKYNTELEKKQSLLDSIKEDLGIIKNGLPKTAGTIVNGTRSLCGALSPAKNSEVIKEGIKKEVK